MTSSEDHNKTRDWAGIYSRPVIMAAVVGVQELGGVNKFSTF